VLTIAKNVKPNNRITVLWTCNEKKLNNRIECVGKSGLPSMTDEPVCDADIIGSRRFFPQDVDVA
jgi:hypothetical protein